MKSTIIELPAWKQKVIITDVFLFTKELKATDFNMVSPLFGIDR